MVVYGPAAADSIRSWTSILEPEKGLKFKVVPETDIVKRFRWAKYGLFDFVPGFGNETSQMLQAQKLYLHRDSGPFPVRIVWVFSKTNSGFYVRSDSKIRTPHDIKPGTRIVDMSPFLSSTRIVDALLSWGNTERKAMTWVPVKSTKEAASVIMDGKADLSFGTPPSPPVMEADKTPPGIAWIELNSEKDPEGARRFRKLYPLVNFGVMSEGGAASAAGAWGAEGINYLVTRAETPPELVHSLVHWLDENYPRLKPLHPDNRFRDFTTLMRGLNHTYIPCHAGLVTYLKEKGAWTEAHGARDRSNSQVVDRYCAAYGAAIDEADEKLMQVDPANEEWVNLWTAFKKDRNLPAIKVFTSLTEE